MTTTEATWAKPAGALFRALGHEHRLNVLEQLRSGPLSGDQLAARTGNTKALLTAHLTRLQRDDLISKQKAERGYIYSLTDDSGLAIMDALKQMFGG